MAKKKTTKKTAKRTTKKAKAAKSKAAAKTTKKTTKKATRPAAGKAGVKAAATAKTVASARGGKPTRRKAAAAPAASTNGTPNAKPTIPAPHNLTVDEAHYEGPLTEEQLRKVKTGLTKKDLEYFRELLLEKRAEIVGSVEGMQEARNSGGGESSHMPLHMADVGSEHFEQEFNLGLMESEKKLLVEIDEALMRIQNGTYGVCIESGKPIPRARLEIKPWAKYTIEVAAERERRGLR